MSDTSSQQQEPSMEEILASIRRIISEDTDEGAAGASAKDAEEDDVLELTEVVPEEPVAIEEPEADEEPTVIDEPEPEEAAEEEPTILEEEEFADDDSPDEPAVVATAEVESDALISEAPAAQAADAIAGLMARVQSSTGIGNRDLTIEQLTRELLRPLLKEWLDANLPDMVERIVTDEIERVVARSTKK